MTDYKTMCVSCKTPLTSAANVQRTSMGLAHVDCSKMSFVQGRVTSTRKRPKGFRL